MTQLTYISHPNKACKGNPFIEVLGYPLTNEEVFEAHDIAFEGEISLEGVPEKYHSYYLRSVMGNLSSIYVPKDEAHALYDKIRLMIEAGYKRRNPADATFKKKILTAIHLDGDNQLDATNLKKVTGETTDALLEANGCALMAAISGDGKTTTMLRNLKLIPQFFSHTTYVNSDGVEVVIDEPQITHLYVQVHKRKGQKAFLFSVVEAVEVATGKSFMGDIGKRDTVDRIIRYVRKLLLNYNVGILVIDEAQNIDSDPDKLTLGGNEKTSMKFVEEIFNRIGVPLFFVGTLSILKLFGQEATIARRTAIDGAFISTGSDVNSAFWDRLCKRLYQVELLDGEHESYEMIMQHLHNLSQGTPAIAVSLMRATLSHMSKFEKGKQSFTMKSLSHVFKEQFSILHKPLRALRKKQYHKYEDLAPINDLVLINKELQEDLALPKKNFTEIASSQSDKQHHAMNDADAEKKVQESPATVQKLKYKPSSKSVPEMDAKLAKKIGVNQLLATSSRKPKDEA